MKVSRWRKERSLAELRNGLALMRFCLEQARKHCGDYLETSKDLRAIETTLFLEALKH